MKKLTFVFLILLAATKLFAQISFLGFDQPLCASPMANTYTYVNTSTGGGSGSINGYKIYKNGTLVYTEIGGSMGSGQSCKDLVFINDSTGFLVGQSGFGCYVYKTLTYGTTWTSMGTGPSGYFGLYPVNLNYAYLVLCPNPYQFFTVRCSDIDFPIWPPFINDDTITADVYKMDTIFGNSLCNTDSLNIFITNSAGDTIDYHINIFSIPLGITVHSLPSNLYTLYPNPSQSKITIEGDTFSKAEIYNVRGQKIMESNSKAIGVEELSKGIYFIRIIDSSGKVYNSKFVKE
jgi:hypothetical protein